MKEPNFSDLYKLFQSVATADLLKTGLWWWESWEEVLSCI